MKWVVIEKNGKGICQPYDGNCDVGKPCTSRCKRWHKNLSSKYRRRVWNKNKLREACR